MKLNVKEIFVITSLNQTEYKISQVSCLIMSITKRVLRTNDSVLKKYVCALNHIFVIRN